MADGVKARRYESPHRRAQAAATRRQILEAAQRLFERDGYTATTMAAIAAEAGVALKTVYVAFETKAGLIRALWYRILRGDPEDVPVAQRDWFRTVLEEPDPVRQLQLNARNSRIVKLRVQGVGEAIRAAAGVDPDGRALWERIQADFYENQRTVVESLAAKDALKDGLDVAAATDRLWTLNHPDVWSLLVGRRGWKPEEYERWLADSSCAQLLR